MKSLAMQRIGASFAHEVSGLQLWKELDQPIVDALSQAWSTLGVLVFRRQALSEDDLVAFSQRLGTPELIVRSDWQGYRPEVIQISNLKDHSGKPIGGLGAGDLGWHTDQSYVANPATGSILYLVEKARVGGTSYWANLQLAYDALPQNLKTQIDGLHAVYDYVVRQSTYEDKAMTEELRRKTPPVTHPLVNTHPVTGKKSLYLDPTTTTGIHGMAGKEGGELLAELNAHATRPEFVYAHDWQIGDVLMWDNGFLLHRRDPFDATQNRWLKRTTLKLAPARHIVPTGTVLAA